MPACLPACPYTCPYARLAARLLAVQAEVWLRASRFHHGQRGGVLAMGRATLHLHESCLYANAMVGL